MRSTSSHLPDAAGTMSWNWPKRSQYSRSRRLRNPRLICAACSTGLRVASDGCSSFFLAPTCPESACKFLRPLAISECRSDDAVDDKEVDHPATGGQSCNSEISLSGIPATHAVTRAPTHHSPAQDQWQRRWRIPRNGGGRARKYGTVACDLDGHPVRGRTGHRVLSSPSAC